MLTTASLIVGLLTAAALTPLAVRRVRAGMSVFRATFGALFPSVVAGSLLPRVVGLYFHFQRNDLDAHGFCGHPSPSIWFESYLLIPLFMSFVLTLATSVIVATAVRIYSRRTRAFLV